MCKTKYKFNMQSKNWY